MLELPKADVLIYVLEDHSRIAIRPSGTEPKIKFYFSVNGVLDSDDQWSRLEVELEQKIDLLIKGIGL